MPSGCEIGNLNSSAQCLSGEATISMPRPFGRSGCVTTRRIAKPASISLSSVGTAKRGVPQKTSLREEGIWYFCNQVIGQLKTCSLQIANYSITNVPDYKILLPFPRFDQLANFALDQVALECAYVADVELAVQVIGFVLESARQQIVAGFFENLAG